MRRAHRHTLCNLGAKIRKKNDMRKYSHKNLQEQVLFDKYKLHFFIIFAFSGTIVVDVKKKQYLCAAFLRRMCVCGYVRKKMKANNFFKN